MLDITVNVPVTLIRTAREWADLDEALAVAEKATIGKSLAQNLMVIELRSAIRSAINHVREGQHANS